jgi:ribosomal protein L12E/L44/L45/RPP1/RPP2
MSKTPSTAPEIFNSDAWTTPFSCAHANPDEKNNKRKRKNENKTEEEDEEIKDHSLHNVIHE